VIAKASTRDSGCEADMKVLGSAPCDGSPYRARLLKPKTKRGNAT
jgi:hypothetical protein